MQDREEHEVIRVISSYFAGRYETDEVRLLAPGYYFALVSTAARRQSRNPEVRYFGPFSSRTEAIWLRTSALSLGIVPAPAPVTAPSAEQIRLDPASLPASPAVLAAARPRPVLDARLRAHLHGRRKFEQAPPDRAARPHPAA